MPDIKSFDQAVAISRKWLPDGVPNRARGEMWPSLTDDEEAALRAKQAAETAIVAASIAAAQHILTVGYRTPPLALLDLWRKHGLDIKHLDAELKAVTAE